MNDYSNLLHSFNINPSKYRLAIIDYMFLTRTHPDAVEIYNALYLVVPKLSMATVYNTMKLFVKKGLIRSISIDGKGFRFDACLEKHGHFFCSKCEQIFDIPIYSDDFNVENIPHEIHEIQVNYKGICEKCLREIIS